MDDRRKIVMNFSTPPAAEDLEAMAASVLEALPDELIEFVDDLDIVVEEFPPAGIENEMDLDSPFDLLALYRSRAEKMPGVQSKTGPEEKTLSLYRRSVLDLWCETEDDLSALIRHVIITEIGQTHGFSEDEINEMTARHHQGML